MKIALLSDTHGYLDPKVFGYLHECDEIWHAGDIGSISIVQQLEAVKPLKAVYGNIDEPAIRQRYPEDLLIKAEGLTCLMTHIAGTPPAYNPRVRKLLELHNPGMLVCGHSHILKVGRDQKRNNMLFINPGAAGNHGFHYMKTLLRFEISKGQVTKMEVVELGKRGLLTP